MACQKRARGSGEDPRFESGRAHQAALNLNSDFFQDERIQFKAPYILSNCSSFFLLEVSPFPSFRYTGNTTLLRNVKSTPRLAQEQGTTVKNHKT